jgi:diguanylate cyclase (GGDEF)-like protein
MPVREPPSFQTLDEVPAKPLRSLRRSVFWVVAVAGAVLAAVAVPSAVTFLGSADAEFWILVALALAGDLRPFRPPPVAGLAPTFVISVCFCFAILLLYGTGVAIVVEVVAVGVAARRKQLSVLAWADLTARLGCSLAAAGGVARAIGLSAADIRGHLSMMDVIGLALVGLVFTAVSCVIDVVAALLSRQTPGEISAQLRFEVLARASVVVLGSVIATTPSGWLLLLLFVPVFGWARLARLLADQERRIEHDPVTGLLSRQGLAVAMQSLPRDRDRNTDWVGLVLIQLRGMPYVIRNVGQSVADHMMNTVASRLRQEARANDLIGRLPGSHLVVLRPNLSDESVVDVAQAFVRTLSTPVESGEGIPFRVDPVAGVAVAPQHGHDLGQLVLHAEAALADAEVRRRIATVYERKNPSDVDRRLALLGGLSSAVNDPEHSAELSVLFQPQVSLTTGGATSVEALVRWQHPQHGLIPTDELIDVVEPTGVMQELTQHVLDRVAAQLAEWNRSGLRLRAAVNVSVLDLCMDDFPDQVADTMRRHGITAEQLDLEITERAMAEDTLLLDEAAHRLAHVGVGLSLDDFGTGFASLRRLRRLPLAEVKIDRSYVSRMVHSGQDRAIVKAIYDLAQVLGLRLVAEGIEDAATVGVLSELGSFVGQGWYYAKPMEATHLVNWLRDRGDHTPNLPSGA